MRDQRTRCDRPPADTRTKHLLYEVPPALLTHVLAALGPDHELRKEYEAWEQALRGDFTKLEARVKARIATDGELALICDLAAGRVKGKQYLKRRGEKLTRTTIERVFQHILHANPQATLTQRLLDDARRFDVGRSLAMELWRNAKIAESTQVEATRTPNL
jgi:hypothetical protein